MKIVVTTPTGNVGSHLVRVLVQAGSRPTLFMRDAAKLDDEVLAHVDVVEGDQLDAADVVRATEGAEALYWVDPSTGADDPIAAYAQLGENAAKAVTENAIPRAVFQSSGGAELRNGAGEIDGLAATEEALDATGASVLHLRCGLFFTNLLMDLHGLNEGVLRVTWPVDLPMPWVDPRDIAEVAAARLLASDWAGRQVQAVHGPEDLSYERVAAIVAEATGRPLRAEQIPDDAMRGALRSVGLGELQVEGILGMSVGMREDYVPENERTFLTTTPTSLAAWAHANLRSALEEAVV
jgi:uncharacterized protein YbjT (DUF2867 family)